MSFEPKTECKVPSMKVRSKPFSMHEFYSVSEALIKRNASILKCFRVTTLKINILL